MKLIRLRDGLEIDIYLNGKARWNIKSKNKILIKLNGYFLHAIPQGENMLNYLHSAKAKLLNKTLIYGDYEFLEFYEFDSKELRLKKLVIKTIRKRKESITADDKLVELAFDNMHPQDLDLYAYILKSDKDLVNARTRAQIYDTLRHKRYSGETNAHMRTLQRIFNTQYRYNIAYGILKTRNKVLTNS